MLFPASACDVGRSGLGQAGGWRALGDPRGTYTASVEGPGGFLRGKDSQGPGWVVPGFQSDVICWVSQAGTRLSWPETFLPASPREQGGHHALSVQTTNIPFSPPHLIVLALKKAELRVKESLPLPAVLSKTHFVGPRLLF